MKKKNRLAEIIDSLFIMILCFTTLLTAMLMKGDGGGTLKYTISFQTFIASILGLAICLFFIINQSEKELKHMINKIYSQYQVKEEVLDERM